MWVSVIPCCFSKLLTLASSSEMKEKAFRTEVCLFSTRLMRKLILFWSPEIIIKFNNRLCNVSCTSYRGVIYIIVFSIIASWVQEYVVINWQSYLNNGFKQVSKVNIFPDLCYKACDVNNELQITLWFTY